MCTNNKACAMINMSSNTDDLFFPLKTTKYTERFIFLPADYTALEQQLRCQSCLATRTVFTSVEHKILPKFAAFRHTVSKSGFARLDQLREQIPSH